MLNLSPLQTHLALAGLVLVTAAVVLIKLARSPRRTR